MKRDYGASLSESTVGRIIKQLQNRGLLTKSISAPRIKRKRNFSKGHAKPFQYKEYTKMVIGESVQIDHMTTFVNGIPIKHFQAWERVSKHIYANIYTHPKSSSAKKFLLDLLRVNPYKLLFIQVDGGSEFIGQFEEAYQEMSIALYVLPPPKRPIYNGGVEQGNRTFRDEFYA